MNCTSSCMGGGGGGGGVEGAIIQGIGSSVVLKVW